MSDRVPAQMPVPLARGVNAAVASPHHLATEAGIGILRAGGSAVDAAIATNAALAVVAGHSCGLGGDAFWLIADPATAGVVALNGSGRSAAGATPEAAAAAGHVPDARAWSMVGDRAGRRATRGARHTADSGASPGPTSWHRPSSSPTGSRPSAGWIGAVERAAAIFGVGATGRGRIDRMVDRGVWASGSGCRRSAERCGRSPPRGRASCTRVRSPRARPRISERAGSAHPRGRPRRASVRLGRTDLHDVSRPDLAEPPAQQLWGGRARDARHPRPPGAAAARRRSTGSAWPMPAGCTSDWRRPASRSPTATGG